MIQPVKDQRYRVVLALAGARLDLSDEKATQTGIEGLLAGAGLRFVREARLGPRDIVDFLVEDSVALEVKLRSSGKMAVHRQLARYAAHDGVGEIVLATNLAMTLPAFVEGKPATVISLGRGWL